MNGTLYSNDDKTNKGTLPTHKVLNHAA